MSFCLLQAPAAKQSSQSWPKQDRLDRLTGWLKRAGVLLLPFLALTLAAALGWWRVEAMIVDAQYKGGILANSENYWLSVLVSVGLMVGASVLVAWLVGRGWHDFDYARQCRKARRDFLAFGRQHDSAFKKLEAEKEKLKSELAEIKQRRREWEKAYEENHGLGKHVGAVQQPAWLAFLKITAVVLLIATGCAVVNFLFPDAGIPWQLYLLVTLALGSIFAYRILQARDRPSARQLYRNRRTIWREAPASPMHVPAVLVYAWVLALILVLLFSSCGPSGPAVELKVMPDLSGSVTEEGRLSSIEAIQAVFPLLRRGDLLTVIPITGDARTEVPGKILRLELPRERVIYDRDLRELCQSLRPRLAELAGTDAYDRSDILGTVDVAGEGFAVAEDRRHGLAILSDFIHHTDDLNFNTLGELADEESARAFAERLAEGHEGRFRGFSVYLGSVLTTDLKGLNRKRREAIRVFWMELFTRQGADVRWVTDGPGQLPQFLKELGREGRSADLECGSAMGSAPPAALGSDQDLGGSR